VARFFRMLDLAAHFGSRKVASKPIDPDQLSLVELGVLDDWFKLYDARVAKAYKDAQKK